MVKQCDNKSVGIIIRREKDLLLIKRKNFPMSFALPAGHLDGDTYEQAAIRETLEETNVLVLHLKKLYKELLYNPCKREGGSHHVWHIYETLKWEGNICAGSDALYVRWADGKALKRLSDRTLAFQDILKISIDDLSRFVPKAACRPMWLENPGLEPVWVVLLKKIGIL